jgi:tRNA-Thr(GGU) m(6)t(6)A37 methyltransferase TsaA
MNAELKFIGHIETPYQTLDDCPKNIRQDGPLCALVLEPEYVEHLTGLEKGQDILVLYWFEGVDRSLALQRRFGAPEGPLLGTFALRSPNRPNPIAIGTLPIHGIAGNRIEIRGMDCLNGTKLLDIKPAVGPDRLASIPSRGL